MSRLKLGIPRSIFYNSNIKVDNSKFKVGNSKIKVDNFNIKVINLKIKYKLMGLIRFRIIHFKIWKTSKYTSVFKRQLIVKLWRTEYLKN